MKSKRYLVVFCVVLVGIGGFSCKKQESISVKVTTYDMYDNKIIPFQLVYLYEVHHKNNITAQGGIVAKDNYGVLRQGITDVNGKFDFGYVDIYKKGDYEYKVSACQAGDKPPCGYAETVFKDMDNNILINSGNPNTNLKIVFNPPPPYGVGDSLRLFAIGSPPWYSILETNRTYSNFAPYTAQIIRGKCYFNIDKYKSGVYTNIRDTVLYDRDTTYTYIVNW